MNIAIFTDSFPPYISGISTYTVELARQLIKNGHKVLIFCPNYSAKNIIPSGLEKAKIIRMRSLPTIIPGLRVCVPNMTRVLNELRKFKVDLIETENPLFLGVDGLISSKILGVPCVSVFHTLATSKEYLQIAFKTKSTNLEKASWIYHRRFYNSSDRVFVTTDDMHNLLLTNGIKADKVEKIPMFFDFYRAKILKSNDKPAIKRYYNLNKKVALYLGRVSPEKNLNVLIQIWEKVVKKFPNSTLLIIGSGIYEKELNKLINEKGLEQNVNLLGEIEHEKLLGSGLLSICDIFISASTSETFGLTGLEAMAHKLPTVLFKSQGLAEMIRKEGVVCKSGDTKAFCNAILKLFENNSLRISMGVEARNTASKFNSEVVVKEIIEIYKRVINNHKPFKGSLNYLKNLSEKLQATDKKTYIRAISEIYKGNIFLS